MSDDPNTNRSHSSSQPTPSIEATIGFEAVANENESGLGGSVFSKQDRDLAFAAMLLRSRTMSEQQLAHAVDNWTTFGHDSLAVHLVNENHITTEQRDQLDKKALDELQLVDEDVSAHRDLSRTQQSRMRLDLLDGSRRIAKLLGVADAGTLSESEMECRTIGARYTLLRRLGQGGLGTVWLARDENLNRYVAVKEITRHTSNPDDPALAHFRREAEITGKLEHPGIVPVYQFGVDESTGRSFYAMRFLGKRTLQDVITEYHERRQAGDEDRMLRHRMLTAFVYVCQAVAHAHSRKVIHRDLKPENIAIDSFGQVVLLDWGLAKINEATGMYEARGKVEPGDLHSIGSTQAGRVLGTPLYMAPEQAAGRLDQVDELTDIFGLGGILYAILTGSAPHAQQIEEAGSNTKASQVFSTIVSSQIIPPRALRPGIPPELDAICMKALSQKRYLRYPTATELADDVERYRAGTPVSAYEAPVGQRITRWMSAHPTLTQLGLLFAALAILGGLAIMYTARRGRAALAAARYKALQDFSGELEMTLQFEVQRLVQDARFVTDFPLTTAISATQSKESKVDEVIVGESVLELDEVTPAEWLRRQSLLFDRMLEANSSYLVISNVRVEMPNMTELVRSERLQTGLRPRRVPKTQLYSGEYPETERDLSKLRSGQVVLTTADKLDESIPSASRSPLVVVALCPIFETSGESFGFNVIELDIEERLEELLLSTAHEEVDVYVTDSEGNIAVSFRHGKFEHDATGQAITKTFPSLEQLFGENATATNYGNSETLVAQLVPLGVDDTEAEIGIIATTLVGGED